MKKIIFNYTANIFLDSGIVALFFYLEDKNFEKQFKENFGVNYDYQLTEIELTISCDKLFNLLEEVYYYMGKEIYDTFTSKQEDEKGNVYYDEKNESFHRFPKINTYGLTELLTNNAQGNTILKENTKKVKELEKENPALLEKIKKYFEDNKLTLLKKLYFNKPYTKITRLEKISEDFFEDGKNKCFLTGESYKKLVDVTNISPFFSGLLNFNSNLSGTDKKISWKAMYLSRFAPRLCFYAYEGKLRESLTCYFIQSDNLQNIKEIYLEMNLRLTHPILKANDYLLNFEIYNFGKDKKDYTKDFTEKYEYLFMLIYTFYKKLLEKSDYSNESADFFAGSPYQYKPISLIVFNAQKFASTMRPDSYEEINNLKNIIMLIHYLERRKGLDFFNFLFSLKFIKPTERKGKNSYRIERQFRNKVLEKIIKLKSVLTEIELLFYNCYKYKLANETIGFKNYYALMQFITLYEEIINQGGKYMESELQKRAINLGKSIGQGILNFDLSDGKTKQENARAARSAIISLKKARNLEQFLDEITRIQFKYNVSVSNDILEQINSENFISIKQFAVIAILNQLNSVLNKKQDDTQKGE